MEVWRETLRKKYSISGLAFHFLGEEIAHQTRGDLRLASGNFMGAVQDFTAALQCCQYTEKSPRCDQDYGYWSMYVHGRARAIDGLLRGQHPQNLELLHKFLFNVEQYFECIRSCPSVANSLNRQNMIEFLLSRSVELKLLEKTSGTTAEFSRPVLSQCDRRDLEKTSGHSLFKKGFGYTCLHCGKDGARHRTIVLHSCSGCQRAWFCDRQCQRKAWKGHKRDCQRGVPLPLLWIDAKKEEIERTVAEKLVYAVESGENPTKEFQMLVRDPSTGRLFDAITDGDVFFMPSERSLLEEFSKTNDTEDFAFDM